MSIHLQKKEV